MLRFKKSIMLTMGRFQTAQLTYQSVLNKKMKMIRNVRKLLPSLVLVVLLLVYLEAESCGIHKKKLEFLHTIHNQVPLPKKVRCSMKLVLVQFDILNYTSIFKYTLISCQC